MNGKWHPIDWQRVDELIDMALEEDLGTRGDATTNAVVPAGMQASARLICKEPEMVLAGLSVAEKVFRKLDAGVTFRPCRQDGDLCVKGDVLAEITGSARGILTAERTALNFLQRLCGCATASYHYVCALKGTSTVVLDTRKTTPGWRHLEKYCVSVGGASNHRIGLFDRIMIKDNHREMAAMEGPGGIRRSVERARAACPDLEIEVEADSLDEVREAVEAGAEYVLLDNMTDEQMAEAVRINQGRSKLEASGGITLERLPRIGRIGVDFVSSGALTHSVKSSDISLDIVPAGVKR